MSKVHHQKLEPPLVHRKIAVLGDRSVGKTALIRAYCHQDFLENYLPTVETTFNKIIRFRKVHFETDILDTAGMDEHSSLSRNASLGVHGYALVFSISSRKSFEIVKKISGALLDTLGDPPDVPRVLVGTKKDLEDKRQVNYHDAEALAESWGVPYVEASSKTGDNVPEVFQTLLKEVEKDDGLLAESGLDGECLIL